MCNICPFWWFWGISRNMPFWGIWWFWPFWPFWAILGCVHTPLWGYYRGILGIYGYIGSGGPHIPISGYPGMSGSGVSRNPWILGSRISDIRISWISGIPGPRNHHFWTIFGPFLDPFLTQFWGPFLGWFDAELLGIWGPILGPFLGQFWGPNWVDFGPILGCFPDPGPGNPIFGHFGLFWVFWVLWGLLGHPPLVEYWGWRHQVVVMTQNGVFGPKWPKWPKSWV